MPRKVAIILVNWNSYDLTHDCIHSLNEITFKEYDIIVVDNGSHDHSGDRLKETYPGIILIKSETNTGFTGGNNLGLRYSLKNKYQYSLLLNNDTFVDKSFLSVLVDYMDDNPGTGVIQSKIFFNHNREMLWNGGTGYNKWIGYTYTKGYFNKTGKEICNVIEEIDWATGCTFFTRNDILSKSGLLAENLFIYYEDVDLSFRIKKSGYKIIYHPESIVYHIAGMANKNKVKGKEGYINPFVHYLGQRNLIWLLKKYTPWYCIPTVVLFNLFYSLAVMTYFVLRLRFNKLRSFLKGTKDGFFGSIIYTST